MIGNKPINKSAGSEYNPIVVDNKEVTTAGWNLVSGVYEKEILDINIPDNCIVYVFPENEYLTILQDAEVFPKTESALGVVKIFTKNIPAATFNVTLNIFPNPINIFYNRL